MGDFFMSPEELKTLLGGGTPPRILDVRKHAAFEESGLMLPDASWHDPFTISQWMGNLEQDTPLIVHCVHGHEVSQDAARTLREAGFDARVLTGGFEAWREAGFDVVPAYENDGRR